MLTKDKQSLFSKSKSSSAFTIIELVIVIVIIGILTAIGIIAYQGLTKRAKETAIKSDLTNARKQLELYKAEYGIYPQTNNCNEPITETNICLQTSPGHTPEYNQEDDGQGYILGITTDDGYHTIDGTGNIVKLTGWKEIVAGYSHTCGLTHTGQAYCWGNNNSGQLGDGTTTKRPTPTLVSGNHNFKQLTAGISHTCGLTIDNEAYCWGSNSYGQLGDGTITNKSTPTLVSGNHRFKQITANAAHSGYPHTCGLATDNKAYCWGNNNSGRLGDGTETKRLTPTLVSGNHNFKQLTAGSSHTCGLTHTGQAYCWGNNNSGQLGDGTTTKRPTPTLVSGNHNFKQLTAGISHTCGLTIDNEAYCWGSNSYGQLGDGTITNKSTPTLVSGNHRFKQITANAAHSGYPHTCGLATDNKAYCWGNNNSGQLGDGTTTKRPTPTLVSGNHNFKQLTAGSFHTCSLVHTGQAYCWGNNNSGQLGDGTTTKRPTPTLVDGEHIFRQLTASIGIGGHYHTCGLATDNKAYCWGSNDYGQLGDGTETQRPTPTLVDGEHIFRQLTASIGIGGHCHTCINNKDCPCDNKDSPCFHQFYDVICFLFKLKIG